MQATEGTSCLQQQCMPIKLSFLPSLVILYSDLSLSFFLSLHPQVLNLWYRDYSHLRLVRPSVLLSHLGVIELTSFQRAVMKEIESVRNQLLKRYVSAMLQ